MFQSFNCSSSCIILVLDIDTCSSSYTCCCVAESSVEEAEKKGELDWPEDKKAQERLLSAIKLRTLAPFLFGQKALSLEVGGVRGCGLIT